ncbi:hypothetical protein D1841_04300 [Neglecta sp. X4]|nr:hypothetical protein [Neglectibacter sp. X4]NBI17154.1 hypothetical protein [Neglectibacter sp. 59]NBJ72554.1 hypothetical protein [Neglectibacter sp. X4]NCE80481.1 hypothetical protein [Neglectibacter sp. X58]
MVPVAMKQNKKNRGKRIRVLAAVLLSLFLALAALPSLAFADEETLPPMAADEPISGGEDITPDPPPVSDPPVDPPVSSDPPDVSSEPPFSSDPVGGELSSPPPDVFSSAPPEEPSSPPPPVYSEPAAPVQTPQPTPRRSASSPSVSRPQVGRPKLSLNSPGSSSASASAGASDSLEPNYFTFARLNQKANSMSITLFYGGAASALFGVIGLIMLLALFLHNRRLDERDGIFEEIAVAEQRQPEAYPPHQPHAPAPPVPPEPYYDDAPQQDSLYTEEFDAPQQEPVYYDGYEAAPLQDSLYTEEFEIPAKRPLEPYDGYEAPAQDSLYTEEFDLPQGSYTAPVQDSLYTEEFQLPQKSQQPAPQKPPAHSAPSADHNPYDTDEILRELLGKDSK